MKLCLTLVDQSFERTSSLGIFNASLGIARGLASLEEIEELVILTHRNLKLPEELADTSRVTVAPVLDDAPSSWRRVLWDQLGVVDALNRQEADWAIFPKGLPPLWRWPRSRVCCYVHDNIFAFYAAQSWRSRSPLANWYFPASIRRAAHRADLVVTNSEFTAEEVRKLGRQASTERVGIGFDESPTPIHGQGTSILLLVSPSPHKLTRQAIDWVQRWRVSRRQMLPVCGVGSLPAGTAWPEDPAWSLYPRLNQTAFEELWQQARVFLYFSAYEGFGMPPIEASLRGIRTLASDLPPHRENLPPSLLFDNASWEDFAAKLDALIATPTDSLFHARTESFDIVARRMLDAMKRAAPSA